MLQFMGSQRVRHDCVTEQQQQQQQMHQHNILSSFKPVVFLRLWDRGWTPAIAVDKLTGTSLQCTDTRNQLTFDPKSPLNSQNRYSSQKKLIHEFPNCFSPQLQLI